MVLLSLYISDLCGSLLKISVPPVLLSESGEAVACFCLVNFPPAWRHRRILWLGSLGKSANNNEFAHPLQLLLLLLLLMVLVLLSCLFLSISSGVGGLSA